MGEVRYRTLTQSFPEEADRLHSALEKECAQRFRTLQKLAEGDGIL